MLSETIPTEKYNNNDLVHFNLTCKNLTMDKNHRLGAITTYLYIFKC